MKKYFLLAAIAVIGLCASAQTYTLSGTKYSPSRKSRGVRTASGDVADVAKVNGYKIHWVALSPDMFKLGFKMGDTIEVTCERAPKMNGQWVVKDRMGSSVRRGIDFLTPRDDCYNFPGRASVVIRKAK